MTTLAEKIAAVRKHAEENYSRGGWDYVVECYSDKDIAERIGRATTVAGAIKNVRRDVNQIDAYRKDIQGA